MTSEPSTDETAYLLSEKLLDRFECVKFIIDVEECTSHILRMCRDWRSQGFLVVPTQTAPLPLSRHTTAF